MILSNEMKVLFIQQSSTSTLSDPAKHVLEVLKYLHDQVLEKALRNEKNKSEKRTTKSCRN